VFYTLFRLTSALQYEELEHDLVQLQLFPRAILVATAQSDATRIDSLTQVRGALEGEEKWREGNRRGGRKGEGEGVGTTERDEV
jgi:hypothetical protein